MNSTAPERMQSQLVMARMHLQNLPPVKLHNGYSLRHFAPGDEEGWNALISNSFNSPADFETRMRAEPYFRPERVWFIAHEGKLVATASAWRTENWGKNTGVIHMVGALPTHRGHHLGYQVSLAALHQFVREGVHHAILQTDDNRLAAIATYLKLGFTPYLIDPNHAERWVNIYQCLGQL